MTDDAVGYGKPPRRTRFQPGKSGNPNGRPKASKNFKSVFERELNDRIPVTENGRPKKITKRDAIAKRLVNGAVNGDLKAAQVVLTHDRIYQDDLGGGPSLDIFDKPGHHLVLEHFVERVRQTRPLDEPAPPENPVSTEARDESSAPTSTDTPQEPHDDGD